MVIEPKSERDVELLHILERDYAQLDFWKGPVLNKNCRILVPPQLQQNIESELIENGIVWKYSESNVTDILVKGMKKSKVRSHRVARAAAAPADIVDYHNYHDYDTVKSYLYEFQRTYPDNVDISYLPFATHEGRRVVMMKLHGAKAISSNRPSIILEAGIHAREWISPASVLYSIDKLLQRYQANDWTARLMLDSFDWHIVPVTNPDGYDYTHKSIDTRLWRKNRRLIHWDCAGVDLNRNFDVYFGTTGVSSNCSSNIYPGVNGFSEPETANIRELFKSINDSIIAYVSVHSYSQFILIPWAFSNVGLLPDNHKELTAVVKQMAATIKSTHGKVYEVGTVWNLLEYAASGSSTDWAIYVKPGIYAMTYELRPDGDDERGFSLPPDEIIPTGQEFLASLETLVREIDGDE